MSISTRISSRFSLMVLAMGLSFLSSCVSTGDPHGEDDHHEHGSTLGGRLLVGSTGGDLGLFSLEDGAEIAHFPGAVPEGNVAVYAGSSGEWGYVIHRESNVLALVQSGMVLESHDGHEDLEIVEPKVWGTYTRGQKPTHFYPGINSGAIFNDGDGTISYISEQDLEAGKTLEGSIRVIPSKVDHGAPVLAGSELLVGYLNAGIVERMDLSGNVLQTFPQATRLHGEARIGRHTVFGLSTGVMLITQTGRNFESKIIPNPQGTPEQTRVGTLKAHPSVPYFVGNFGKGLAIVDPELATLSLLSLETEPQSFGFDRSGEWLVVLGKNGSLYIINSETRELSSSVSVASPLQQGPNADGHAASGPLPVLALGSDKAYVSLPQSNKVLEIHLDEGEVEATWEFDLAGSISSMVVLETDGVSH